MKLLDLLKLNHTGEVILKNPSGGAMAMLRMFYPYKVETPSHENAVSGEMGRILKEKFGECAMVDLDGYPPYKSTIVIPSSEDFPRWLLEGDYYCFRNEEDAIIARLMS